MAKENEWNTAGGGIYWNFSEEGEGATVQGVYIAKKEHMGEFDSTVFVLRQDDGNIVNINASTVLKTKFDEISEGMEVLIEYLGKADPKKGGKEYHNFDVKFREVPFKTAGKGDKVDDALEGLGIDL